MTGSNGDGVPTTPESGDELARLQAENEQLKASLDRRVRWRTVLTWLLVVLTSLSIVTAAVAVWAHQVVFDNDRFMRTVQPALEDPELYVLVGDKASLAVLEALDVETRLTTSLEDLDVYLSDTLADALELGERARRLLQTFDRPSLSDLAPPIAAALETRIDNRIHQFFSSEAFTSLFPELVARVHRAAIALARSDLAEYSNVYVADGQVRLNLVPYIGAALRQVGDEIRSVLPDFDIPDVISDRVDEGRQQLAEALQASLPEDFGQVTVISEDTFSEVQAITVRLDRFVWLTVLVALALIAVTIGVSPNRRRTVIHLSLGVVLAMIVVAIALRRLNAAIVESILDPSGAALAARAVSDFFVGLRNLQLMTALAVLVIACVAYLSGRPAWFVRLSDSVAEATEPGVGGSPLDVWVASHSGVLQAASILLAGVTLFFAGLDLASVIAIGLVLGGLFWFISAAKKRVSEEEPISSVPADVGIDDAD